MTRRVDLVWLGLALPAAALAVWLGIDAVDVSPVFSEVPLSSDVHAGSGR